MYDHESAAGERWYCIQNFVDMASGFHQASVRRLKKDESITAALSKDNLESTWTRPYGTPDFVLVDEGPEHKGKEFVDYCDLTYMHRFQRPTNPPLISCGQYKIVLYFSLVKSSYTARIHCNGKDGVP